MTPSALSVIVTNARVRTGDAARPWVTALGLRDGKLAVAGSAAEILKMAGSDTTIIDARGQTLTLPPDVTIGSELTVDTEQGTSPVLRAGPG